MDNKEAVMTAAATVGAKLSITAAH